MRCALYVEPPVVHLGNVVEVRCEPSIMTNPGSRKRIMNEKTNLASFNVVVQGEHTLSLEYTAKR